jgi:hypothetical protein
VYAFFLDSDSGEPAKLIYVGQNTRPRDRFYEILKVVIFVPCAAIIFSFQDSEKKGSGQLHRFDLRKLHYRTLDENVTPLSAKRIEFLVQKLMNPAQSETDIRFDSCNWVRKLKLDDLITVVRPIITKIVDGARSSSDNVITLLVRLIQESISSNPSARALLMKNRKYQI